MPAHTIRVVHRAWAIVIYVTLISRRAHHRAGAIYPDREYCFRNSDIR